MNKKIVFGTLTLCGALIFGGITYATKNKVILATIGNHKITQSDYDLMISDLGMNKHQDVDPTILTQMVEQYIMSSKAKEQNLSENKDIIRRINFMTDMVLRDAYIVNYLEKNLSEKIIEDEYHKRMIDIEMPIEYHAAHILLKNENAAKNVLSELKQNNEFSTLAKEHSTGPTGANGGDLGFFTLDMMVEPFSKAVKKLKIGAISEPVKTNFGWHIIKLIDKRQKEKPSFETLKSRIRTELSQKIVIDHLNTLKNSYQVEYHIDMPENNMQKNAS